MADQNITALPVATSPTSSDQLLLVGATEEKLIDYDKLADAILTKLTSKQYTLDQGTKTLPAALNELNSNRLIEHIKHGQTKEIAFDNDYGCLMFVYHPYFGVGLYGFCTYDNTDVILVTTILEQPQNSISLSLKGRTLKITSKEDSAFCIFKSTFY